MVMRVITSLTLFKLIHENILNNSYRFIILIIFTALAYRFIPKICIV